MSPVGLSSLQSSGAEYRSLSSGMWRYVVWRLTADFRRRMLFHDRLCGLSGGGGEETVVGLERGPLSLVSPTEELLDRKVAAPV
jgi:hypothetical protein